MRDIAFDENGHILQSVADAGSQGFEIFEWRIAMTTYNNGNIATHNGQQQIYSFDPWGRRRNPYDWSFNSVPNTDNYLIDRGFTGHEHLDLFGLINMNGRMYDPLLGRMLSPDNYVQAPDNSQGFNRYSYVLNNPLIYTDPDGEWFFLAGIWLLGGGLILQDYAQTTNNPNLYTYGSAMTVAGSFAFSSGITAAAPPIAGSGFFGGFVYYSLTTASFTFGTSLMSGNDPNTALKHAGIAGLTAGILGGLQSGINSYKNKGSFWFGGSISECPAFTPLEEGEYTGYMGSDDLTEYTHNTFGRCEEYVTDVVCGNECDLPKRALRKGYIVIDDQIYNPDGEPLAGITIQTGTPKSTIWISSAYKDYTGYLYPLAGHEVIHAWHNYTGFMAHYGSNASEFYAHKWSGSFPSMLQNNSLKMSSHYYLMMEKKIIAPKVYPPWVYLH